MPASDYWYSIQLEDEKIVNGHFSLKREFKFFQKGIYIYDGKYYFHTDLKNITNFAFQIDFINFKVVDTK